MATTYPVGGTYNIPAAGTADVIDMGYPMRSMTIKIDDRAAGECWVRCGLNQTAAPDAPSGTPAPSDADLSADGWQYLKGQGSSYSPPITEFGYYRYIEVWGLTDGGLSVTQ